MILPVPFPSSHCLQAAATSASFLTKVSQRGSEEELGQKGGRRKTGVASGGGGRGKEKKGGRGGKKREEEEEVGRKDVPRVLRFLTTEEVRVNNSLGCKLQCQKLYETVTFEILATITSRFTY